MTSRIAGLVVAAAGILGATIAPASAAPAAPTVVGPVCLAMVNHPCAWQSRTPGGVVGGGLIDATGPNQQLQLKVEVRIQRAWGSPWETVASVASIRTGSIRLTTPAVNTDYRTIVCVTGGPAASTEPPITTCTV
ncbi:MULTISPECIES: hypothetical protein [Kitasatospora]|uniref:Secreted protein n=2 Tax=Kitasatospora TaxID=2063 RepID=A0ABT1IV83_9ACTN|nr:hypothetical protein [Kitasatospora paracochleata]MCP2309054.1 hypothetical protein [Kitasatospora paracochleata]